MRVVEFTGGSTGSSLAMVCAAKGYPCVLLSSDAFAEEKLRTMRAFGADLRMVPSDGGKVTPALFERFQKEIARLAAEPDTFWTDQFHNTDALDGYAEIGRELLEQTGGSLDVFCGAVGTGGMLNGVARALRAAALAARIVALEPASSPAMTAGARRPASRRGHRHRPHSAAHGRASPYDEARAINEDDARAMARRLAREEGLLVGTSSGLNVTAAIALAQELGAGNTVATVAVDTGLKYLAGRFVRLMGRLKPAPTPTSSSLLHLPMADRQHHRIVARRSVDRRHLAAHRPDVGRQLAAVMDRVEEEQPEEVADRLLHPDLAVHHEAAGLVPRRLVHRLDLLEHRFPRLVERIDHLRRRQLGRRAERELAFSMRSMSTCVSPIRSRRSAPPTATSRAACSPICRAAARAAHDETRAFRSSGTGDEIRDWS